MSHFTVLVIGDNVEEQLAPYEEELGENPKWDWWVTGGRWSGFLKLKPGAQGALGEPGAFGNEARPGGADVARKGDIDFEGMMNEAGEKARKYHRAVRAEVAGLSFEIWKECLERNENNIEAARKQYQNQEAVQKLAKAGLMPFLSNKHEDAIRQSEEEFVNNARRSAIMTFAVVKDGEWFEKGEMGWWGIVDNEKNSDQWCEEFEKLVMGLSDNTLLTIVDCHI